jgi:chromosome segregation ATPase
MGQFDQALKGFDRSVEGLRKYKVQRKDLLASAARGDNSAADAVAAVMKTIKDLRHDIASLEAAVKNATPTLDQVEQQAQKDLAGLTTAAHVMKALINDQVRAVQSVRQKLEYALADFDQAEADWRRSKYRRFLTDLDSRTEMTRRSIAERATTMRNALQTLEEAPTVAYHVR